MKVAEIFRSLQGEGRNQGLPCTFVRLSGCNLRCRWCDTPDALQDGTAMNIPEVVSAVRRLPGRYVCITGGEPLLQKEELVPILHTLASAGYKIDIETNGTIGFSELHQFASICMDVKCPSSGERSDLSLLAMLSSNDSVKYVVADEADCRYAEGVMRTYRPTAEQIFSPVSGSDYRTIARFALSLDPPARFQMQLHKILGVR